MTSLGLIHTIFSGAALVAGAVVLLLRKGTTRHRRLGWSYVISMAGLNVTALLIYRLTGHFGPFHVAAIVSLVTVGAGAWAAVRRRPAKQWLARHYYWMTYSYVGLVAAAVAEVVTRLQTDSFWWAVIVASAGVFAVGAVLVRRRALPTLSRMHSVVAPP